MQHRILEGKNSIITGARRGIGLHTLKVFAKAGSNVWACIRKPDEEFDFKIKQLEKDNNVWIKIIYFDLNDEKQIKDGINMIRKDNKKIDILVNNAGTTYDALLPMISITKAKELFNINFFAQILITQLVSRLMMKQKSGCIINMSSYLAEEGNRGQSMYSATKGAISAFTRSIAQELSEYNVRVNAVAPGIVNTELLKSMNENDYNKNMERCMLHRAAEPLEIGNSIVALASEMNSYINGQIIRIDGFLK